MKAPKKASCSFSRSSESTRQQGLDFQGISNLRKRAETGLSSRQLRSMFVLLRGDCSLVFFDKISKVRGLVKRSASAAALLQSATMVFWCRCIQCHTWQMYTSHHREEMGSIELFVLCLDCIDLEDQQSLTAFFWNSAHSRSSGCQY